MQQKEVDKFVKAFALALKEKRISLGLSHEKLAELSGLSRTTISNIESGKKIPTIATSYRIANAMKVSLNELFR